MSDTLDQYNNELKEHLVLDEFNIKDAQMKLPGRKHLWVGRLMRHKQEKNNLIAKKKQMVEKLTKSIQEQSTVRLSVPADEKVAGNTEPIKKINSEIAEHELLIEFLEKVEKIMSGISYDIKNIIEIQKLETM